MRRKLLRKASLPGLWLKLEFLRLVLPRKKELCPDSLRRVYLTLGCSALLVDSLLFVKTRLSLSELLEDVRLGLESTLSARDGCVGGFVLTVFSSGAMEESGWPEMSILIHFILQNTYRVG